MTGWARGSTENFARNWSLTMQMAYAQPRICPGECDAQTPQGFWDTNGQPNLGQTTRPCNNHQQKERTCRIVDLSILADYRVKLKESEKKRLSTSTMIRNWKNCGTWKWRWYQLGLVLLRQSLNAWYNKWRS